MELVLTVVFLKFENFENTRNAQMKSTRHAASLTHEETKCRIRDIPDWKTLQQGDIRSRYETRYGEPSPSQSVVSRIVHELRDEERLAKLEADLVGAFTNLKRVCLVAEDNEKELGAAAANEFNTRLKTRKRAVEGLALGSGKAVGAFVDALARVKRMLVVAPTSLALRRTDGASQDAVWNVLKFHWQSGQGTSPLVCAIPPFVKDEVKAIAHLKSIRSLQEVYGAARKADFIILGIGSVTSGSPILDVLTAYGVDGDMIKSKGVTSEINLSLLDEDGADITAAVFGAKDRPSSAEWDGSHPAFPALGFETLKEIANDPNRVLMAIASGQHKVQPIRAALMAGLINILVTDSVTAEAVLAGIDDTEGK